jgi:hypothetical protein
MEEREFFNETVEQRTHSLTCPKCGQAGEYKVAWVVRRKRAQLPRGADERDRARCNRWRFWWIERKGPLARVRRRVIESSVGEPDLEVIAQSARS